MDIVLTVIALQQGLFALGWGLAGWLLGLSRRAATHWGLATLGSGLALVLILQRGRWPDLITIVLANVLAAGAFVAVRRGVQVFLRLPTSDREAALQLVLVALAMGLFAADPAHGWLAVLAVSTMIAWTLLRCAWEARRALCASGDVAGGNVVAAPLALLGSIYVLRALFGLVRPDVAARPLNETNAFNGGVVISFLIVGLVLNMVLAYMVANRLVRRLHQRSVRDPLTGLLNRRGLAPQLLREATRLRRHNERFAVLAVDVDHFKAINDEHGHAAGDAVLVQLGALLRQAAREVDTVARTGGEEFCLLLPHTDLRGAGLAAERLCALVRAAEWPRLQQPLTVSVGVALAGYGDRSAQQVLERADQALLQAKGEGRNRVVLAGEVPPGCTTAAAPA